MPDTEEARLVVIHPEFVHTKGADDSAARKFAQQCLDTRGSAQRVNRNTLVFLAPDDRRMEELGEATRDYLAWENICGRTSELGLAPQQQIQAERRRDQASEAVRLRISATYIWVFVPEQQDAARPSGWQVIKSEGSQEHLADRVGAKLRQGGLLATSYGARNVRMDLDGPLKSIWQRGRIPVGELWAYYCRYPYLSRLRDRAVLDGAVKSVLNEIMWETEGFALAGAYDETAERLVGLALPHMDQFSEVTDTTLLVAPEVAKKQRDTESVAATEGAGSTVGEGRPEPYGSQGAPGPGVSTAVRAANARPTRFFGTHRVDPERYSRDLTRVSQEILQHLAAEDGVGSRSPSRSTRGGQADSPRSACELSTRTPACSSSSSSDSGRVAPRRRQLGLLQARLGSRSGSGEYLRLGVVTVRCRLAS